jgi:hypothetical protein
MSESAIELGRAQVKRLRHYFNHGAQVWIYTLDGIDLDLAGFGLIQIAHSEASSHHTKVTVTEVGLQALHKHRQADIANRSVHHSLGNRLAAHLRSKGRMTWENIEFKNLHKEKLEGHKEYGYWRTVRPDVFSMNPTLNIKTANPCVHEVKVTRADFLSDMAKPEKRDSYRLLAEVVYYVAPEGIIQPSEIPEGFGLLVENAKGEFVQLKRANKRPTALEHHHYLNLILKPGELPQSWRE